MLKINLKQLEAFVATAEFRSFTKAAETLYLTQSTVSSHIHALESILDVRLIQRSARQRVTLTKEGEAVYREAKDILDRCQTLQDLGSHNQEHQLVIGASTVPGQCLLPEIMSDFLQTNPGLQYVQLRGDSQQVHQYLTQGKARLGFVGLAADIQNFQYLPVANDRLVLITADREPYLSLHQEGISGMALLDQPMILREESSGTRQEMARFLHRQGKSEKDLQVIAQIDNPEAIKSSVSRGLGVSVISVLAAGEEIRSGRLLAFELGDQGACRQIYLTWHKQACLSEPEHRFLNFVRSRPLTEL